MNCPYFLQDTSAIFATSLFQSRTTPLIFAKGGSPYGLRDARVHLAAREGAGVPGADREGSTADHQQILQARGGHCQLVDADTSMRQRSGSMASLLSLMRP